MYKQGHSSSNPTNTINIIVIPHCHSLSYEREQMDTHYRYHRDEVTMERSHDPIMYRGDDVDVYDGYQRSEILMECEKFPPSQPGQTRIKAVDSFMIRTQTADFTALDFSPQRPRPQPSAPPPPPPVSELESTTHLKFENSQWQINDPRNRSASSAAGGGGAGGGITTYQPVDNNHHTMPKIQQLLNESAGAGDNHTDQPFAKEVNMNAIFTCGSPGLFFRSVDALLLFQCFFISIVFTQLIPLVSYGLVPLYNPGWIIGFILLILFNFYIIQLMLNKAVLLRAVYQVDHPHPHHYHHLIVISIIIIITVRIIWSNSINPLDNHSFPPVIFALILFVIISWTRKSQAP